MQDFLVVLTNQMFMQMLYMRYLIVAMLLCSSFCFSQETIEIKKEDAPKEVLDSLYREDQFYIGFTFNLLSNRATDISQSGFSGGMHFGFTRDMPFNKKRNKAIGVGLGYSVNTYGQNLFIGEEPENEQTIFLNLSGANFSTNRFTTHLIEMPLEYRWRTSNARSHKFYRIYTGLRLGYLFSFNSNFEQENNVVRQTKVDELDRFRLGTTFTFGWNTFNFHFYYSLNSLFDDSAMVGGEPVGMNPIKIGLMFYVL